jgi:hypothetical protein
VCEAVEFASSSRTFLRKVLPPPLRSKSELSKYPAANRTLLASFVVGLLFDEENGAVRCSETSMKYRPTRRYVLEGGTLERDVCILSVSFFLQEA